jgi:hypothetical protein
MNTLGKRIKGLKMSVVLLVVSIFSVQAMAQNYAEISMREESMNSSYREKALDKIQKEVDNAQAMMTRKAEKILLNLPLREKLYDEGEVVIKSGILNDTLESGDVEMNYFFEISYNCSNPDGAADDYPAGAYNYSESNSCKAICALTKQFLDDDCKGFFTSGKEVHILITSTTDAEAVAGIPYKGEYGDFRYSPVVFDNVPTRLTLFTRDNIKNNCELAFLRAQSVKNFLEKKVSVLKGTSNNFNLETWEVDARGSQYRRSSIRILVHKPFDERLDQMVKDMKTNDTDIDINIPETGADNKNTFVLIISNENYQHAFPKVQFADNDSKIFYEYCTDVLGVPERQIRMMEDASKNKIQVEGLDWLKDLMKVTKGKGNIIIYYNGHGILDYDHLPYIIPSNAKSLASTKWGKAKKEERAEIPLSKKDVKNLLEESLSIEEMCKQFDNIPCNSILFICDAGFNGKMRDGSTLFEFPKASGKVKGLRLRGSVILMTAAGFNETVYEFTDKNHGFFTYYFLKTLRETLGDMECGLLFENVKEAVSFESSLQGKQQIPFVTIGGKIREAWESHKLK